MKNLNPPFDLEIDLVDLAMKHYNSRAPNPRLFAEEAARLVAHATVLKQIKTPQESAAADLAVFIAAAQMADQTVSRLHVLANVTESSLKALHYQKAALAALEDKKYPENPIQLDPLNAPLFSASGNQAYQLLLGETPYRNIASTVYMHTYCSTYAAFVHASAYAATKHPNAKEACTALFRTTMLQRLSSELGPEPIDPMFFIALFSSEALLIIGEILLVIGLIILIVGVCGLSIQSVGGILGTLSIDPVITTITGSVATAVGIGTLFGYHAATQKKHTDNIAYLNTKALLDQQGALLQLM